MANAPSSSPQRTNTSLRKTNKPLMEKRRRARINESLTQLKSLVIQSSKKDSSQFNKLEKADILELTVKHLRTLQEQHQQQQMAQASDPTLAGKYQAGFMECANEVIRYIGQSQGFTDDVKCRVIHHLASCLQLSNKTSFTKPIQQVNPATTTTNTTNIMPNNGLQTVDAKLPNGQIIQIVSNHFQNTKNCNNNQFIGTQSIPIAVAPSSLSVSSSTHVPIIITSDPINKSLSTETSHIKYTQPLHIQIPPVVSPVVIQPKITHQKLIQPQVIHKIQDILPQVTCNVQQETLVSSSSTPSPQPTDIIMASPTASTNQKSHIFYTHGDHYSDYIPRSRTYSLTSSISTESELTSPLNLSQSPKYYDQKEINYSVQTDRNHNLSYIPDKTSPTHFTRNHNLSYIPDKTSPTHFTRSGLYQSRVSSSNFTSVIVDARKSGDNTLKYMYITDEEQMLFRHDGTSSPASSMGEERLWRPW